MTEAWNDTQTQLVEHPRRLLVWTQELDIHAQYLHIDTG